MAKILSMFLWLIFLLSKVNDFEPNTHGMAGDNFVVVRSVWTDSYHE